MHRHQQLAAHTRAGVDAEVRIGDLGSGSDYTPFIQHLGVPSTDIGSDGPYGVYHSAFDNYTGSSDSPTPPSSTSSSRPASSASKSCTWPTPTSSPTTTSSTARDPQLPRPGPASAPPTVKLNLDFTAALAAAHRFAAAGSRPSSATQSPAHRRRRAQPRPPRRRRRALLIPAAFPTPLVPAHIYAPGEFTGYAAVVIPGVNEAIDAADAPRAQAQLALLADALNRAAAILEAAANISWLITVSTSRYALQLGSVFAYSSKCYVSRPSIRRRLLLRCGHTGRPKELPNGPRSRSCLGISRYDHRPRLLAMRSETGRRRTLYDPGSRPDPCWTLLPAVTASHAARRRRHGLQLQQHRDLAHHTQRKASAPGKARASPTHPLLQRA